MQKSDVVSQSKVSPQAEPEIALSSGSGKIYSAKETDSSRASPPSTREQGLPGIAHPAASCRIDFDKVIECYELFPKYRQYFSEKLGKIARLQELIENRELRAKGETFAFLNHWQKYFTCQINNTISYLTKGCNEENKRDG